MNIRSLFRFPILAAGMACGLAAAQAQTTLSVTPNPAPADKAFILYLQGVTASCYTTFSRESVTVSGTKIYLRYTTQSLIVPQTGYPDQVCPMPLDDAGPAAAIVANLPVFNMPALKAGKYEVWATNVPACRYTEPSCAIAEPAQSAGVLEVRGVAAPQYDFSPDTAKAGVAFSLHLVGSAFDCATSFSGVTASVFADGIQLSFLPQQLPKGCGDTAHNYGPTFVIPALKAGSYPVMVNRLDMNAIVQAGTLTVTGTPARTDWYLKQRDIAANQAFTMQLLRDDVGNCQTSFSNESTTVLAGSIHAYFVLESHPERVCVQDIRPYGPSFAMQPLAPGLYPVVPHELATCQVAQPACAIPVKAPMPTDTLVVAKTLAIPLSALRAGAPKVDVRGDLAFFALPAGGTGAWRTVLLDLEGRVLDAATVTGAPGQTVSVPVGRAPKGGLGLLRLVAPDGAERILAIPRF